MAPSKILKKVKIIHERGEIYVPHYVYGRLSTYERYYELWIDQNMDKVVWERGNVFGEREKKIVISKAFAKYVNDFYPQLELVLPPRKPPAFIPPTIISKRIMEIAKGKPLAIGELNIFLPKQNVKIF